ncbi:MAG: hypothetical protein MZW92_21215 [Comamonadaceae bacterium]|nr:hypothetical protein [Comamonadaceae bacterium]
MQTLTLLQKLVERRRRSPDDRRSDGERRAEPGPVLCVVGARPELHEDGAASCARFAAHEPPLPALLVHTGQHYDARHERPPVRRPAACRGRTSTSRSARAAHAVQTAEVMKRFEPVLDAAPAVAACSSSATSTPRWPARWWR